MSRTATDAVEGLRSPFKTLAMIDGTNARTFMVRGWPFTVLRNGAECWDVIGPHGIEEACDEATIQEVIEAVVLNCEAENAGWDFDPEGMQL